MISLPYAVHVALRRGKAWSERWCLLNASAGQIEAHQPSSFLAARDEFPRPIGRPTHKENAAKTRPRAACGCALFDEIVDACDGGRMVEPEVGRATTDIDQHIEFLVKGEPSYSAAKMR